MLLGQPAGRLWGAEGGLLDQPAESAVTEGARLKGHRAGLVDPLGGE